MRSHREEYGFNTMCIQKGKENERKKQQRKTEMLKEPHKFARKIPKNLQFGSTCKDEEDLSAQHSKAMSIHQRPE